MQGRTRPMGGGRGVVHIHISVSGRRREGGGGAEGSKFPPGPTLIGPQLESESLKFSRFFKLVRPFLKLRAPWPLQ